MMLTSGAQPCAQCGTAGGYTPPRQHRPGRKRGLCYRCYDTILNHGNLDHFGGELHKHPFFPHKSGDIDAFNRYLWHDIKCQPQHHAIYPHAFDARAEVAEAEHDAARWLMTHPMQPLLDWGEPQYALFGAANAERPAA